MNKKVIYIVGSILILAIVLLILKAKGVIGSEEGIKVATEKVTRRNIIEIVSASGKIYPETEVKVSSDVSGQIVDLFIQEGDSVHTGQVIAKIYPDIYKSIQERAAAAVSQAQAQLANISAGLNAYKARLDQAKAAYGRNQQLLREKVISRVEFEQSEAAYRSAQADYNAALQQINSSRFAVKSAQADLQQATKNVNRTTIEAPMSGVVSLLAVKKGERVVGTAQMAGTEMLRIADLRTMEVRVDVGENDIPKVHYGDTAIIEVDAYSSRKFKGIVTQIASSSSNAASLQNNASAGSAAEQVTNYTVRIRILPDSYQDLLDPRFPKNFPFRPGMSASVDIQTSRHNNVLAVPINAVTTRLLDSSKNTAGTQITGDNASPSQSTTDASVKPEDEIVFVLQRDGTVKAVKVMTGIQDDAYIEVTNGLQPGNEVVSAPYSAISKTLKNGSKVKVMPKDKLFESAVSK